MESDLSLLIASMVALPPIVLMMVWVRYANKELRQFKDADEDNE